VEHDGEEADVTANVPVPGNELAGAGDVFEGNEVLRIATSMADTDVEQIRWRVAQVDNFKEQARDAFNVLERHYEATLGADGQSLAYFHQACQETRAAFDRVLDRDGLQWDQEKYVLDQLMELVRMQGAKDTESKDLLKSVSGKLSNRMVWIGAAALVAAGLGVAVAAPKAAAKFGEALRGD